MQEIVEKVIVFICGTTFAIFFKDWLKNVLIWKLKDFAWYRLSRMDSIESQEKQLMYDGFLVDCENRDTLFEKYIMVTLFIISINGGGSVPQLPKK